MAIQGHARSFISGSVEPMYDCMFSVGLISKASEVIVTQNLKTLLPGEVPRIPA